MSTVSVDPADFLTWTWDDYRPIYEELASRNLDESTVGDFLVDWSAVADRAGEQGQRLHVASDANTADAAAADALQRYTRDIQPQAQAATHRLQSKLLQSGLQPESMEFPLSVMKNDAALFRQENLPLKTTETMLGRTYYEITGAQTITWDGAEIPISEVQRALEEPARDRREAAWRLAAQRRANDRDSVGRVWKSLLETRTEIASNAGLPDYRAYRWQEMHRFHYTPDDAKRFDLAVEQVVVPSLARRCRLRAGHLGIPSMRPWDLVVDEYGRPGLVPFQNGEELLAGSSRMFHRVNPVLGSYFDTMREEQLLDLEPRANKSPGGYCTVFDASRRPFIFLQGSKTHGDVETVMHEGGHAFHVFETNHLPYHQQRSQECLPMEFAEVASMAMELLSEPYLAREEGGFYSAQDAARARRYHLDGLLFLWSYIAVGDLFQHWVYEHPKEALDLDRVDAEWTSLTYRFFPEVDWTGLETELGSQWQSILHFFVVPFYMIDYGLAQLGAVQVWANSLQDPEAAIAKYRHALSLGATRPLPELFAAAGAKFSLGEQALRDAVGLIEQKLGETD
ncbi:MAG: M3 family oligoendopeptidase [Chloroflexota bacterium]